MDGLRNEAWLALCVALSTALGCLPESDDLGAYAAEWSPAAGGGGASAGSSGSAGAASAPAPDAEAGAGADGVGAGEGVGGGDLPLAGVEAASDGAAPAGSGGVAGASGGPSEAAEACPDGVLGPDSTRCYLASEADAVWQSAREQCLDWQGALVRVDTAEEDRFIETLVSASQWLGASDTVFDNVFVWTDGSPLVFGNWGPGQPDRFPGPDCIEKRASAGGLWFDQPCDLARAFVCEKAVPIAP
jgi:hypothetical protein